VCLVFDTFHLKLLHVLSLESDSLQLSRLTIVYSNWFLLLHGRMQCFRLGVKVKMVSVPTLTISV